MVVSMELGVRMSRSEREGLSRVGVRVGGSVVGMSENSEREEGGGCEEGEKHGWVWVGRGVGGGGEEGGDDRGTQFDGRGLSFAGFAPEEREGGSGVGFHQVSFFGSSPPIYIEESWLRRGGQVRRVFETFEGV